MMNALVKDSDLSSVGLRDMLSHPIISWIQISLLPDDLWKHMKVVLVSLIFRTLDFSSAMARIICGLCTSKGISVTGEMIEEM